VSKKKRAAEKNSPAIPPLWAKVLISSLLMIHLTAVFVPPFRFASLAGPDAGSPVAMDIMETLRPYIDAAYLDHGYFYFAPNPGASHLVRYEVAAAKGQEEKEYVFPDLKRERPRLLYHRHFMLSETFHRSFAPPQPPADLPPAGPEREEELTRWQDARHRYELMRDSIENHLSKKYGQPIHITRVEHRPPSPGEALDGMRPSDPSLFSDLSETEGDSSDGALPAGGQLAPFTGPAPFANPSPFSPLRVPFNQPQSQPAEDIAPGVAK